MRGLGRLISYLFLATIAASCAAATATAPAAEMPSTRGQLPAATTPQPATPTAKGSSATTAPRPAALTVTITRSAYGSLSAQTAPGATCSASARLPSGRESTAQGLDTHNADASGNISWTYRTVSNTGAGTGTYTVICSAAGQSKTVTAPFTVQ
jgi:hypothetical protein